MYKTAVLTVLLVAIVSGPAAAQVRVTPETHLENVHGDTISYERFIELVKSGRFVPEPVRSDGGEVVGYRLARPEAEDTSAARQALTGPIRGLDRTVQVPMEVAGGKLLVPATVHGPRGSERALFWLDTGTFVPAILLPEIRKVVGRSEGRLDSLSVAGVTVKRPATGRHHAPDVLRRLVTEGRKAANRFTELPLGGVLGGSLFDRAIASLDAAGERLVLRPADAERRALYDRDPVAAAEYRTEQHNVWIPATVDGSEGYAHLDTGYSYTWLARDVASDQLSSFRIGGVDLLPHLAGAELRVEEPGRRYESVSLEVIANLGVDALGGLVVTIDPPRGRVYFECPRPTSGAVPHSSLQTVRGQFGRHQIERSGHIQLRPPSPLPAKIQSDPDASGFAMTPDSVQGT